MLKEADKRTDGSETGKKIIMIYQPIALNIVKGLALRQVTRMWMAKLYTGMDKTRGGEGRTEGRTDGGREGGREAI